MPALPLRKHTPVTLLLLGLQPPQQSESSIEKERVYTKSARALDEALQGRGPAGSPNFWNSVVALMRASQSEFWPRFVANRVPEIKYLDRPNFGRSTVTVTHLTGQDNFDYVASQIRSPAFVLSPQILTLATEAAKRLAERQEEDIGQWADQLAADFSKIRD
jgi:hypothetical protein